MDQLSKFIWTCPASLFGQFKMSGIPCDSDADCLYGAACDMRHGLCNHTMDHLLECYADMDAYVSEALFNFWQIMEPVSREVLKSEIYNRYIRDSVFCEGPDSLLYRYKSSTLFKNSISGITCTTPSTSLIALIIAQNKILTYGALTPMLIRVPRTCYAQYVAQE